MKTTIKEYYIACKDIGKAIVNGVVLEPIRCLKRGKIRFMNSYMGECFEAFVLDAIKELVYVIKWLLPKNKHYKIVFWCIFTCVFIFWLYHLEITWDYTDSEDIESLLDFPICIFAILFFRAIAVVDSTIIGNIAAWVMLLFCFFFLMLICIFLADYTHLISPTSPKFH